MPIRKVLGTSAALLALSALFAVYVFFRPLGVHVSDSYAWVNTIEEEAYGYFFHPHHLLYLPLAWRWNQLVQAVAPAVSVWASLASMSAVFGCAGIVAVYAALRRLGAGWFESAVSGAFVAFAFGYWFFASEAEVYVVSAALGLWSFYFLAQFLAGESPVPALWAGVMSGLAALMHQTGIFLFVPAAIAFLLTAKRISAVRSLALFSGGFLATVVPPYILVGWAVLPHLTLDAFVGWLFLFAGEGYGGFKLSEVVRAPIGLVRAIVGGQMALDVLRGAWAAETSLWFGLAAAGAGVASVFVLSVASVFMVRRATRRVRAFVYSIGGAFIAYAVFGTYFDAVNVEWWVIPVTFLMLGVAASFLVRSQPQTWVFLVTAILLAGANFLLDFSYRRRGDSDLVRNAARSVTALTGDGDVIVAPSYLGVLVWNLAPEREVFCPDEAARVHTDGEVRRILEEMQPPDGSGGRFVLAGETSDAATREFTREVLALVGAECRQEIGSILFFDGGRRIVNTVSRVPVTAIEARAFLDAVKARQSARRDAGEGN